MTRRVLLLPSWYPSAARPRAGTFCREQAEALANSGADVTVVHLESFGPRDFPHAVRHLAPTRRSRGRLRELRVACPRVPTSDKATTGLLTPMWSALARFAVRDARPDVIHAHGVHDAGIAARLLAGQLGIPWVVTEHYSGYARGLLSQSQVLHARSVLGDATAVVAVSLPLAETLRVYRPDVRVIPNMVDTVRFTYRTRPAPRPFTFIVLGYLTKVKRVDLALEALARLPIALDSRLLVAGDGPERRALEAKTAELGLRNRVTFMGDLRREEVVTALHRSHALVSTSDYETFGVALIEAMATGIPVLATRSGGPNGFVNDSNGKLVPTGDSAALATAMQELIEEHSVWQARSIEVAHATREAFGPEQLARALCAVYDECGA